MSSLSPSRMPAWLAPVCEDRSVSHSSSRWLPSASQRAMFGRGAVADRAAQHRQRQPVDLEEQDARARPSRSAARGAARPAARPAACTRRRRRCPVDDADRRAHGGGDQRDGERRAEAVDVQVLGREVGGDQQHRRVEREHEQEADRDRERQPQRRDHRRQQRRSGRRRSPPRRSRRRSCGRRRPRTSPAATQQGQRRGEPRHHKPERPQPRSLRAPGRDWQAAGRLGRGHVIRRSRRP